MALATYDDLVAAVANWLDADLGARVPEFISLFEATLNRTIRVRQQLVTTSVIMVSGVGELPDDYLEWKRITFPGDRTRELEYAEPDYIRAAYPSAPAGIPRLFSIEGSSIVIRPVNDASLELQYYKRIPALTADGVNWLYASHPDAYLWGALVEAHAFRANQEGQVWAARRDTSLAEIERLSQQSRGQARIRAYGATP